MLQTAIKPSADHHYLNLHDIDDVIGQPKFYRAAFNSALFSQLRCCRDNLDREYASLQNALKSGRNQKIRNRLVHFNKTLSRYLEKNRKELCEYLLMLYKNDRPQEITIAFNMQAIEKVREHMSAILDRHVTVGSNDLELVINDLRSVWVMLKRCYYNEKTQLYPLYPTITEAA